MLDPGGLGAVPRRVTPAHALAGSVEHRIASVDRPRAAAAIRELLTALGLDPDHPALATTPQRASEAFIDALTVGYDTDPADALGRGFPTSATGPVLATNVPFVFVCPHHLTPARAIAHVGFVPKARAPGLSRITKLLDVLGRRLVLQEDLTEQLADVLFDSLDAAASVAVIEARHGCVALEDFARRDTIFTTRAQRGPADVAATIAEQIDARIEPRVSPQADEL